MRILLLTLFLLLLAGSGKAQSGPDLLPGFATRVSGEDFEYHSPVPGATKSLLVRSIDANRAISWQTALVPRDFSGQSVTFVVLAGIDVQQNDPRRFRLLLDGREALTFSSPASTAPETWTVAGPSGVRLRFDRVMVDSFDDVFGYMHITVPAGWLKKGAPVQMKVEGESAGSSTWFMVFQYAFDERSEIRAFPALVRKDGREVQLAEYRATHFGPERGVRIFLDGKLAGETTLKMGFNSLELTIPRQDQPASLPFEVRSGKEVLANGRIDVQPVRNWNLYLLPHSHVDIGYTEVQTEVEKKQWGNIREAIRLARQTANYPPEARYKWNVEVLWAVDSYLKQATPEERAAFIEAVRQGSLGLQATYANLLTGLSTDEELLQFTARGRALAAELGREIPSAMISDIPGYSWGIVPALAHSGVRYLSSGPNLSDRIGFTLSDWGDRPFYWVSPSGNEKILLWVAGKGYSWFHGGITGALSVSGGKPFFDYLAQLDDQHYPYDIVQIRYTVGGDNGPPDDQMSDFVRTWSEKYVSPRLVIATSEQLFKDFEQKYGSVLPSFSGDFTPYWEDGAVSTARETAQARNASNRLIQAGTLWSIVNPKGYPRDRFSSAWREVLLFNEHTWGAHNSISEPDAPFATSQWDIKRQFAVRADEQSKALLAGPIEGARKDAFDIYNTTSWPRTEVVVLPGTPPGGRATDASGNTLPTQRLSTGELAVLVPDVPALGAKRIFVRPGAPNSTGNARALIDGTLRNENTTVSVHPRTGAIRSFAWRGIELADTSKGFGLNAYLYVPGKNPADAQTTSNVRVSVKEPGPLVASLRIESDAPGSNALVRELVLVSGEDQVQLVNQVDRKQVRTKEGVHFGFPFRITEPQVRVDLPWGVMRPEADQLSGACKDFLSVQRWVDVSNQRTGVTLATLDAPLLEVGNITAEAFERDPDRAWSRHTDSAPTVFSYVMNNYWHTNYKADQAGLTTFRYALRPHGTFRTIEAQQFGIEESMPLVVLPAAGETPIRAPFRLEGDGGVIVSSIVPGRDSGVLMVRLYNAGGRPESARLVFDGHRKDRVYVSDLNESRGAPVTDAVSLPAFGLVTLRIEKAP